VSKRWTGIKLGACLGVWEAEEVAPLLRLGLRERLGVRGVQKGRRGCVRVLRTCSLIFAASSLASAEAPVKPSRPAGSAGRLLSRLRAVGAAGADTTAASELTRRSAPPPSSPSAATQSASTAPRDLTAGEEESPTASSPPASDSSEAARLPTPPRGLLMPASSRLSCAAASGVSWGRLEAAVMGGDAGGETELSASSAPAAGDAARSGEDISRRWSRRG